MSNNGWSNEDLAYAAGLIDGEGCITLLRDSSRRSTKNGKTRVAYSAAVVVSMTDCRPVRWLHETFGGMYRFYPSKNTRHGTYHWSVRTKNAGAVLRAIMPWLKEKGEQADLLAEYCEFSSSAKLPGRAGYPKEIRQYRESVYRRLQAMKRTKAGDDKAIDRYRQGKLPEDLDDIAKD